MNRLNFFLLIFVVKFLKVKTGIISKSSIELCSKYSNSTLNCTQKLVLALSIENGKLEDTETIEAYVTSVTNQIGEIKNLQNPYKINIRKTPVYLEYPCTYVQDFNFRPKEEVISSDVFSCKAGDLEPNPTCGWAFTSNKITLPYSQGFCCKCDFTQIIGIDTTSRNRGSNCGLFNLGAGSASAHCLRFDKLWYSTYEIKPFSVNYNIDITITYKNDENDKNFTTQTVTLSPSNVKDYNDVMIATLIGDFNPPTQPTDYSNYYLTIPTFPETHSMVREGPTNWMIIPKNYFTLDGRECDKIGVGYFAFKTQNNQCSIKIGECLHNQIYDYYMEDLNLLAQGKRANHLIFSKVNNYDFFSYSKEEKKFSVKLNGLFNTLITLELIADDIKYMVNVSNGVIDYAIIKTFESLSNDGILETQITNSDTLTAMFSISFNCSNYILPIQAEQISLKPFQSEIITKDIYTLNQDFRSHDCNVTLKNAVGKILDAKGVFFNTTKVEIKNNQAPNKTETNETKVDEKTTPDYIELTCQQLCPSFFDFLCFVAHGCWGYFARTVGIILLVLIFIVFIIRWIKKGGLCKLLDKCVDCFSFKTSNKSYYDNNVSKKQGYMNFSSSVFDFSKVNLNQDFSVKIILYYNEINMYMNITDVEFFGNFKTIVNSFYKEILTLDEIRNIMYADNEFITNEPKYNLIN